MTVEDVQVEIIEETPDVLTEYEKVSIAFRVETRFRIISVDDGLRGMEFIEEPVSPYVKDYDASGERPADWGKSFDLSRWGIFSAFDNERRIGGAAVAWRTSSVDLLEGRDDLACLWDLRVDPDCRTKGVGAKLFSFAVDWARRRDCRQLKIETQNINVPACRFYVRQGCELGAINKYAYQTLPDEVQLLWYRDL